MSITGAQIGRGGRAVRRGFTLIELGVSSAIVGVLMVSLGSVVMLTAKALPEPGSASELMGENASALEHLAGELRCAVSVTEAAGGAVTFRVADRDGDDAPEEIRYSWSGAGNPLMRQYNGAAGVAVTGPLDSFVLDYDRRSRTETATTTVIWNSGEVLLSSFSGWSGIIATAGSFGASSTNWGAEKFQIDQVNLPADTSKVVITRASIMARSAGTSAGPTFSVGIHAPASSGSSIPATSPVGSAATINTSTLTTSFAWVNIPLNVTLPNASRDWILVIKGSGTSSAVVRFLSASLGLLDPYFWRTSSNSGGSWSSQVNTADLPFFVYGYYERPQTTTTSVTVYNLTKVQVFMRPSGEDEWLFGGAETLNKPEVSAP